MNSGQPFTTNLIVSLEDFYGQIVDRGTSLAVAAEGSSGMDIIGPRSIRK